MGDYKRRNINIDKLSSYVRRTGICTEEAALHLMDEIMFLRADVAEKQTILKGEKEAYRLSDQIATARMQTAESKAAELLETVKLAYRKHHLDDSAIGWDELDNKLLDSLCNAMGDGNFNKWLESV